MKRMSIIARSCAALISLTATTAAFAQSGQTIFAQRCAMCHAVGGKGGKIGPDLTGVVGRKTAGTPYAYSPAFKKLAKQWSPAALDAFLAAPSKFAPGTRMTMAVPKAEDRAALIVYLTAARK